MSELGKTTEVSLSRPGDRPRYLWAGQTTFDVVLDGSSTGGSIALLDRFGGRGDATPVHIHRDESEIFYVVEGTITAWAGDDVHELGHGSAVYLPAGKPHAFRVDTDKARILTITAPAGFADFIRAAGIPSDEVPAHWDFDLGRVMAAAPEHGIEIVGPPPQ